MAGRYDRFRTTAFDQGEEIKALIDMTRDAVLAGNDAAVLSGLSEMDEALFRAAQVLAYPHLIGSHQQFFDDLREAVDKKKTRTRGVGVRASA